MFLFQDRKEKKTIVLQLSNGIASTHVYLFVLAGISWNPHGPVRRVKLIFSRI